MNQTEHSSKLILVVVGNGLAVIDGLIVRIVFYQSALYFHWLPRRVPCRCRNQRCWEVIILSPKLYVKPSHSPQHQCPYWSHRSLTAEQSSHPFGAARVTRFCADVEASKQMNEWWYVVLDTWATCKLEDHASSGCCKKFPEANCNNQTAF